jgi:hypothetical protein
VTLSEGEGPRTLGQFSDYDGMLAAVRARAQELQVSGQEFDAYAGLPIGYLSKLTAADRPVRRIGHSSMGVLYQALGIYCVVVEDPVATARLKARLKPRNGSFVRSPLRIVLTKRFLKINGRKGGQLRWQKLTKEQRSTIMRALAQRRWRSP